MTEPDRAILDRLISTADVFLENLGPGSADRLGFGAHTLRDRWPRLVVCGISGYGTSGPLRERKAFDLIVQGETGIMSITGTPAAPGKVGISIADISAGMYALAAILAALFRRERSGRGDVIEISMLESLAEWLDAPMYHAIYQGAAPGRSGMRHNMIGAIRPIPDRRRRLRQHRHPDPESMAAIV